MIENVDYHITDKCNLNCVSCNHFCPLVPKEVEHKSMSQITDDLLALSRFKDYIRTVTILGGEPTLHPQLNDVLYLTRALFPYCELHLTTNGTTWNKFEQWKDAIIKNDFKVIISKYPWHEKYEEYDKHIMDVVGPERCVTWDVDKAGMQKGPLVLKRSNTNQQILDCRMRGACCQLKDKHLYICNYAAQIDYLYEAFPFLKNYIFREGYEKIDLTNKDINIFNVENMVYSNIPAICFYCNECTRYANSANMITVPWKKSEKKIDEWIS